MSSLGSCVVSDAPLGPKELMKHIREKREKELKRIVKNLNRMKLTHENHIQLIVFDYLYMKVRQMQRNDLLFDINIPTLEMKGGGSSKAKENG